MTAPAASEAERAAVVAEEERTLFAWVEALCEGRIARTAQTSGGNRARSWAIDIERADGSAAEVFLRYSLPRPPSVEPYTTHREAQVYRAIADAGLMAPRLIAEHPTLPAILTEQARGIAEFRRLKDPAVKMTIAGQFMDDLARLHAIDASGVRLDAGVVSGRIADHVRAEVDTWRAMYAETGVRDPLIEFAFRWLDEHAPDPDGAPVLAHGDAGPGNFMFEGDRLTAVIDWELAHLGDPMGDLAWFSMRCVMEPVPDFGAALRMYAAASGRPLDRARILYHRVLVSARVVVIRHRNVTGEPGAAIVSRALNRRLLVQALADASGCQTPSMVAPASSPTVRGELYSHVLDDLRDVVASRSQDRAVVAAAKNASKVLKYLQAWDRYGAGVEAAELEALGGVLGARPAAVEAGRIALADALARGDMPFDRALAFFALQTAGEGVLAAAASGGIATRRYPPLELDA